MKDLSEVLHFGQGTVLGTKAPLPDPPSNLEATLLLFFTTLSTGGIGG